MATSSEDLVLLLRALSRPGEPPESTDSALVDRLGRVVTSAVEVLGVDGVGLMLLDSDGTLSPVAFTDQPVSAFEEAQAQLGEGPGVDTGRTGQVVEVSDLAQDPGYATLWRRIAGGNVRAVLSCPVVVQGTLAGNLNCIRSEPHSWSAAEVQAATAYGRVVGITLQLAALASGSLERAVEFTRAVSPVDASSGRA